MKRLFVLFLSLFLIVGSAAADPVDLSGMSFDDLVALRDQLNLAIWNCQEWQEVTVPAGVWKIGEDIPAGHWTIRPLPGNIVYIYYCDILDEYGKKPGKGWSGWDGNLDDYKSTTFTTVDPDEVDLVLTDGMYIINSYYAVFTPYAGKPDLGFK